MRILEAFHKDQQRVLDRLVDGELGQAERRELLAALDDEPGGWRSCALAFLEAQSFRWQFTRVAAEQALRQSTSDRLDLGLKPQPSTSRGRGWWSTCLAVAASVMLAFGLGSRFPTVELAASPSVASSAAPTVTPTPSVANATVQNDPLDWDDSDEDALQSVTLAVADGDESDRIELPVATTDEDPQQWLDDLETTVPAGLLERLRAAGFEVIRIQRLYPLELSDGRRLVVPVEQVDIRDPGAASL